MSLCAAKASSNPTGGTVASGNTTSITGQGTTRVTITSQDQRSIIRWENFSNSAGEVVRFDLPATAVSLNRVTGPDRSIIGGRIEGTGHVMLINPNGISITKDGVVDLTSFTATSANILDRDFLSGNYHFRLPGSANAGISNDGTINVSEAGLATLVAPTVRNSGEINARLGRVTLAAGDTFSLDFNGDGLLSFLVGMRLSLQKTFDTSELTSWSILQGLMLGSEGTRLELAYTESITQPGENLRPYQFRGEARIASATVLMPLERGRYFNLRTQFGIQHLDSRQTAYDGDTEVYHDRLDMLTAEGSVDWQDNWMGGGLSVLNLNYTQGISGGPGHPTPSRPDAAGEFGKLEFFVNRFQALTQRVSLQLAAGGQRASDPLVSSEQYSLGGYPFGRGFDMSSIAGDHGLAGKAELRYDVPDRFGDKLSSMVRQMSLFGFYDAGKVWSFHKDASSLACSGWGLRGVFDATPMNNVDKRSLDFEVFMAWKQHTPDGMNDDRPVVKARLILNF